MIIKDFKTIPVYVTKDGVAFYNAGIKKYRIAYKRGTLKELEDYFDRINNLEIVYLTDKKQLAIKKDSDLIILPTELIEVNEYYKKGD